MIAYILLITICFDIVVYLLGRLWTRKMNQYHDSIAMTFAMGFVTLCVSFHLIGVPAIFLCIKLSNLISIWAAIIVVLLIVSVILCKNLLVEDIKGHLNRFKPNKEYAGIYIGILLFLVQIVIICVTYIPHQDDNRYVAVAVDAYETNEMLTYHPFTGEYLGEPKSELIKDAVAPINMFWAALAMIFRIHPTILMHTVTPLLVLPLCYGVYWLIGKKLLGNDYRKLGIFLCVIAVFNFVNHITPIEGIGRLSYFVWWGKSVLVTFFVPLTILLLMNILEKEKYQIPLIITMLGGCLATTMTPIFLPLIVGCYAIQDFFLYKKISRFAALIGCCVPALCYAVLYFLVKQV